MKRFLRRSLFALAFAFGFLFCGAMQVNAAEAALNNTKASSVVASFDAEDDDYYVVSGGSEDYGSMVLKAKKHAKSDSWFKPVSYTAKVAVVTCKELNSENACASWSVYEYDANKTKTMDALKSGLTLNFSEVLEKSKDLTNVEVYGANVSKLSSIYGLDKTSFVVVQYTWEKLFNKVTYEPDILRVVFADEVAGMASASAIEDGKMKLTFASVTPIAKIRYFSTTSELPAEFDFETEYAKVTTGVEVPGASDFVSGSFTQTVSVDKEDGKYYYFEAVNVIGNEVTHDPQRGISSQTPLIGDVDNSSNSNTVGKIILIALLIVLVLAVVLVIVQRIVDYRKKLY